MEKPVLISEEVNYAWNFLNYPIHTITAKPKEDSLKIMCNFVDYMVLELPQIIGVLISLF